MKTTGIKKTIDFNVKLSQDDKDMLTQLAADSSLTMSEVMRASVARQFRMRFANEPKCSTGNLCLCPNMHTLQQASRPSDADILRGLENTNGSDPTV